MANFLGRLRRELVVGCPAQAHVTVLPPRPLEGPSQVAEHYLQERLPDFEPLRIELGEIEIFQKSDVIYLSIASGYRELERMHDALNAGPLAFKEPFQYHPHLTLAQELDPSAVPILFELATRRWSEFRNAHEIEACAFHIQTLTFVQNTVENCWMDLAAFDLATRVTR